MKKQLASLFLFLAVCNCAIGQVVLQSYPFQTMYDQVVGFALDGQDNRFLAGSFTPQPGSTNPKEFLRKTDANGTLLWSAFFEPTVIAEVRNLALDPSGNAIVSGYFSGQMQLQNGIVHNSSGNRDIFVAKYSNSGVLLWSKSFGSLGYEIDLGIASDGNGDIIFTGNTSYSSSGPFTINFGGGFSTTNISFVTKLSPSGNTIWATGLSGYVDDLSVNASGTIAVGGEINGPLAIAGISYPNLPNNGQFVATLSSGGTPVWVKDYYSGQFPVSSGFYSVEIDNTGAVAVGRYQQNTTLLHLYAPSGAQVWSTPLESAGNSPVMIGDLKISQSGEVYFSANHEFGISFQGITVPNLGGYDFLLGKLDAQGNYAWGISGADTVSTTSNEYASRIGFDSQNQLYLLGNFPLAGFSNPLVQNIAFGNYSSSEVGSFLYKVATNGNKLSGSVFYDFNLNSLHDTGEPYAVGQVVTAGNSYGNVATNGQYSVYVGAGTHTLTVPTISPAYTAVPASQTVSFSGLGNTQTGLDFALQPIPNMPDLQVSLTSHVAPRPGFAYPLTLAYKNAGSTTLNATLTLTLGAALTFGGSTPAPSSQTGNTLTWSFANLAPIQGATITLNTQVPATTPLGNTLNLLAQIEPVTGDVTPANNSDAIAALVVGSFDPNDKQVSQNHLTPTEVSAAKPLEYTIRFQNTGTAAAINVKLTDTLDSQLNAGTLELLASSHPNTWSIRGNGILEWRFDNILLPDSTTNEAASHGFVKYRIRPNTNLALGSIIRNTAAIYFDFNAPVITNTTTTEVALVSAVTDVYKPQLQVYPNPSKGAFTVQLQNVQEQSVKAEIRNVLGQVVWQQSLLAENGNVQQQIKTYDLSKGIYYLQVGTAKGSAVQKVVIE